MHSIYFVEKSAKVLPKVKKQFVKKAGFKLGKFWREERTTEVQFLLGISNRYKKWAQIKVGGRFAMVRES